MGGGVGLTWHSPVRIATDNSMYAMPETAIGFFCDVGGSYFLARVKDDISLGLYIGLTGQRVKSRDLVKWGIATHFVESARIPELYERLQQGVTAQSTDAEIDGIVGSLSDDAAASEPIPDLDQIREIFQPDSVQGIMQRLDASQTEFAAKTKKMMTYMSPLSLAVVFEQIKRGKDMNMADVFQMEYGISQGYMQHTEFFEGVRALLVDKDKSPQWKHRSVGDISRDEVEFFFNRPEKCNFDITKA
uniref:3-hydroxyisobutyryl-CoA hydrolase n=1 Tax=Favella ehrenbergii TaxID=182087 RepID=A0A7S3I1Q5_9SPIT|mmetsp:Transcript_23574/g.31611  ORF Transcript_23574/g.31611 Transcript_23574/m.31611 type:complete len:246 (-) Transcript_23574:97-834(-)